MSPEEAAALYRQVASDWQTPLPCGLVLALVQAARAVLLRQPTVPRLSVPPAGKLVVVGDTHGHLKDLVHIWTEEGLPSADTCYLFNGDICDRGDSDKRGGQQALHIFALVLSFKLAFPDSVFINRGNHEDSRCWNAYGPGGFSGEIESKYSRREADQLIDAFDGLCECLPLACVLDKACLIVHGGLPRFWEGKGAVRLAEVEQLVRPYKMLDSLVPRQSRMVHDLLWSDPQLERGLGASPRGGDVITFGPDVTETFLHMEELRWLVRSHEVPGRQSILFQGAGFEWWHPTCKTKLEPVCKAQQGLCLTIFSASDYCGCAGTNKGARLVFKGSVSNFEIIEHLGNEAEKTLLQKAAAQPGSLPVPQETQLHEQQSLSQGVLDRGVVEAIVQHKHELLAEFMSVDREHDWFIDDKSWVTCCYRVLPLIPWEDYVEQTRIVPRREGRVCYTAFLTRYQIQYRNKMGLHAGFRRRLTDQVFEGLLRCNCQLREYLEMVDSDGDGRVSVEEFGATLARFGKVLTPARAKTLYRTTVQPEGCIQVEDFLSGLALHFALTHPRPTTEETHFVPERLDAICRDILDLGGGLSSSHSMGVILREFFEKADSDGDGYLSPAEFVAAIRPLRSCADLKEEHFLAIASYIDINGDRRINYVELLQALSVRRVDAAGARRQGPKALLEDMLEAVHRVLHFEFAKPLRTVLRRLSSSGCTRCTPAKFHKALHVLNGTRVPFLLTEQQIQALVDTLDTDRQPGEVEGHFDFEDFFNSFRIVDTLADEDANQDSDDEAIE